MALAWHFGDEASSDDYKVLDRVQVDGAIVPAIWPLEVTNGLVVAERRGRVTAVDVALSVQALLDLPIAIENLTIEASFGSAVDLARALHLSAYDASYLALAMREGVPLATRDDKLRVAAERVGVPLFNPDQQESA